MEQAIKKEGFIEARNRAVKKGGFNYRIESQDDFSAYQAKVLLKTEFWQALGKAEGWKKIKQKNYDDYLHSVSETLEEKWRIEWHRFIDHIAEGKPIDDFFNELLK